MGPTFNILSHYRCYNDECECQRINTKDRLHPKSVNLRKVSLTGPEKRRKSSRDSQKVLFL